MVRVRMPGEPSPSEVPSKRDKSSQKAKPYRPKVQGDAPPPKPLKIHDNVQSQQPKKKEVPKGKGKKVVVASPEGSADDGGDEFIVEPRTQQEEAAEKVVRETLNISKGQAGQTLQKGTHTAAAKLPSRRQPRGKGGEESNPIAPSDSSIGAPSQTQGSVPSDATEEDFGPPEGYVSAALKPGDKRRYASHFAKRKICPAIYIDLAHLKNELKRDVNEFLNQYEPWIGNHLSFSPSVVRNFYCNLQPLEVVDDEGEVLEKRLETSVRGRKIELSAKVINQWLGIQDPPADGFVERSDDEIVAVLKPEGEPKGLNFRPSTMSEDNRILWYIYTRAIVSKGNNFTSFTRRDYGLFASLVAKDVRNLGAMIMNELLIWRENAIGSSSLPFPHLISLFLKSKKIWYLEPSDDIVRVPRFGRTQLSKMGLQVPPTDGEGEAKIRRKRKKPEAMEEVQSTRGATPEPPASLQEIVKNVVREALGTILSSHLHMMEQQRKQMEGLFKLMDAGNTALMELMRTQIEKTQDLSDRLQAFEALLPIPEAPPEPSPPSQPVSDPISSQPIELDPVPHPFTHDINPKLPSPPVSSGHPSPSHISRPSSPQEKTTSPVSTGDAGVVHQADIMIDQVLTSLAQETSDVPATPPENPSIEDASKGEEGKSEEKEALEEKEKTDDKSEGNEQLQQQQNADED